MTRRTLWFVITGIAVVAVAATAALIWFVDGSDTPSEATVFQFALSGGPDSLDPHATAGTLTFQVVRSIYDTLVEPDQEGEIVPALAERWNVSPDNLVWEFTLREGVRFHNDEQMTSADVKASLERLIAQSSKANAFAMVERIETPDDMTVILTLSEPAAPLMAELASGWSVIMPKSLIDAGHDFNASPVGTGPFRYVEWVQDSRIVLTRNDDYWIEGLPLLGGVVFNIVPEAAVRAQGLIAGDFHAIESFNEADRAVLEAEPGVKIRRDLSSLVNVLAMNTNHAPFDNLSVRQAVAHAIDKQAVLDVAYGGGVPVGTFMDYLSPYYVDFTGLYPYNPELAGEMLAASGYDSDSALVMAVPSNYDAHVRAAEMYHQMLTDIGLRIELRLVDWSTWISDVYRGGSFDFTVIGHTGKLDPHGRLANMGNPEYYVHWDDPETQRLIRQAARVLDPERRRELYSEALGNIARAVPHVYIGTIYRDVAMRERVYGFYQDTQIDTYDFRYTELR